MYDLAIIGASPEGISAAQRGIRKYPASRIALMTQGWERVWADRGKIETFHGSRGSETDGQERLRQLAALGVDVIDEGGNVTQTATGLVWQGDQRTLAAQAYLLTTDVERYQATQGALTPIRLTNPKPHPAGVKTWGIRGAFPQHLVLAQQLAQYGHRVQLFTRNAHLLPGEDREMSYLLQCYLEAQGIKIWPHCQRLTDQFAPESQTHQLSIQSGATSHDLQVDQFLQSPLPTLPWHWLKDLPDFFPAITANDPYVEVNDCLQTAYPQIFACGGWIKGYTSSMVTRQEADYVVDRVLDNIQRPINYAQIPFGIDLTPPWYRVGLSEQRAREQWEKIHVYYGYEAYQGDSPLRGACKILTNPQDHVVGAHWFGPSAKAGISLLTLGMANELTVELLKNLPVVDGGVAQGLQDLCRR